MTFEKLTAATLQVTDFASGTQPKLAKSGGH